MAPPMLEVDGITTEKWDEVARATSIVTARRLLGCRPDPLPGEWRIGDPSESCRHAAVSIVVGGRGESARIRVRAFDTLTALRAEQMAGALIEHAAWLRRHMDSRTCEDCVCKSSHPCSRCANAEEAAA